MSKVMLGVNGDVLGQIWCSTSVVLTDESNTILLPMGQRYYYTIPGYDAQSSEIVFSDFPNPLHLSSDRELRLWYGEDLVDGGEHNIDGTSCTDVFAKYL